MIAYDKERHMLGAHPAIAPTYDRVAATMAVKRIVIPDELDAQIFVDEDLDDVCINWFWMMPDAKAADGYVTRGPVEKMYIGKRRDATSEEQNATADDLYSDNAIGVSHFMNSKAPRSAPKKVVSAKGVVSDVTQPAKQAVPAKKATDSNTPPPEDIEGYQIGDDGLVQYKGRWIVPLKPSNGFTGSSITKMNVDNESWVVMKHLAYYIFARLQVNATRQEDNHLFAMGRLSVIRKRQYVDSKELQVMQEVNHTLDATTWMKDFIDTLEDTERYQILEHLIAISFLRSGHHATAFNMYSIIDRILGSLSIQVTPEYIQSYLRSFVYHGGHVGSTRVQILQAWSNASDNEFIGSIAYRLHPAPPMFATYVNLELFIDQLNVIGFFENMGKTPEYASFKSAMNLIKKKMHFSAPYAQYLYGRSEPDPTAEKAVAIRIAAYCTAIANVMPNSSLIQSPALQKLITTTSSNSISANLLVEAYVSAYRAYHKRLVERKLTGVIGAPDRNRVE